VSDRERAANPNKGKERRMGLGAYPDVSLPKARKRAEEARGLRDQGIDPIDQRDLQRGTNAASAVKTETFDECVAGYIADHQAEWGPTHLHDWESSLKRYVSPVFGSLPVAMVETAHVLKVLRPIWRSKYPTARILRERIESILAWAKTNHYRSGENPARWKDHLINVLGKTHHIVENHPALPHQEVGALVAELRQRGDRDALCLQLLILTATRVSAAAGAKAEEFDLTNRVWKIPPSRMKRRGKHKKLPFRIPLSEAAIEVIERVGVKHGRLFPGADHTSLKNAHGRSGFTIHGFRSAFRDWCSEMTSYSTEVIEMAMAHRTAGETEAAYFRSDLIEKRRGLMNLWSDYCAKPAASTAEVVPIRKISA
jgi:integrase